MLLIETIIEKIEVRKNLKKYKVFHIKIHSEMFLVYLPPQDKVISYLPRYLSSTRNPKMVS